MTTKYRLSFSQERLFFIDRLEDAGGAYHVVNVLDLRGPLDEDALRRAVATIVERHDALRARFGLSSKGTPCQWIDDAPTDSVSTEEAGGVHDDELHARLRRVMFAPFDLESGPLFRVVLLRRGPSHHLLACAFHHIVFDGWSWGIFVRELAQAYDAYACGRELDLPELSGRYVDYASWLRKSMAGGGLDRALEFWKRELDGGQFVLDLPSDRHRPAQPTFEGGVVTRRVDPERMDLLRGVARARGATTFMTLLAAFAAWLSKHTGARDIVIGTPVAGRTKRAAESMIGFFVNTLPLRLRWDRGESFGALVARAKATVVEAFAHQEIPLAKLVEAVNPERDRSRSPLFQVALTMDVAVAAPPASDLQIAAYPIDEITAPFDVTMACAESDDGSMTFSLNYSRDLFDAPTAERMMTRWLTLVDACALSPDSPVDALAWIDAEEQRLVRMLASGGETELAWRSIPSRAAEVAAAYADRVAVRDGPRTFSYREWEARSNALAQRLIDDGIAAGSVVAVSFVRSADLVLATWAVMKAGAAFVPLDPELPRARLDSMARAVGAALVLSDGEGAERWRRAGLRTLEVHIDDLDASSTSAPAPSLRGDHLAYVLFTSGSTGTPKAVMDTHQGLCGYLEREARAGILEPDDVMVLKAPCSFDLSVHEMFTALTSGATLVIAAPGGHRDPDYLATLFAECGVTACLFVPSMLAPFLDRADGARCPTLRKVMAAGEALPPALARRLAEAFPAVTLVNGYGPAETCPTSTKHVVTARDFAHALMPIGRPPENVRAYVTDDSLGLVPFGVPGELCIGGLQVGRGYFDAASLTAERFVPDPFTAEPGARMYRTGDRVRLDTDGQLTYLGRLDHQVKLRGMRIELGEIEAHLRALDEVSEAVVVVRKSEGGHEDLAAYVVASPGAAVRVSDVLGRLREALPGYMIPASLVVLDEVPLSPNGKVDRARLPAPGAASPSSSAHVAPRNELEARLATIWCEVLGRDTLGVFDDFFDVGGHSLAALTLLTRVEQAIGRRAPLAALFEEPTIARMAREIGAPDSVESPWIVTLARGQAAADSSTPPLFVLPGIAGDSRPLVTVARHLAATTVVYGLMAAWHELGRSPPETLDGFADAYLEAIRAVCPHGPYRFVGYSAGCSVAWTIAERLAAEGEPIAQLVLVDGLAPGQTDAAILAPLSRADTMLARAASEGRSVRVSDLELSGGTELTDELRRYGLAARSSGDDPTLDAGDRALVRLCAATLRAIGRPDARRGSLPATLVIGEANDERAALRRHWAQRCGELIVVERDADHSAIVFDDAHAAALAHLLTRTEH